MACPVTMAVIGAGERGCGYAYYSILEPEKLKIVAVADPDDFRRNKLADAHGIPEEMRFRSWQEFAAREKMCDAVAVCTQDAMHEAPAVACAERGYDILLEKPMAPTAEACRHIVDAVNKAGVIFAVCHVLRYTNYTLAIRKILESGEIGDIVNIQHLEPLGYWHQAHSYVRGNWRREADSSSMLLAKGCHDLDWIRSLMGRKCVQVHSFGTLRHFRKSEKPAGAGSRCTDCPKEIESCCPYSACKIYFRDRFCKGKRDWPVEVLVQNVTGEALAKALTEGPYGRCVYACDNDVVDNQVVNLLFEDGATASFTMTAFNFHAARKTRIFGTLGEIETDSEICEVRHFLDESTRIVNTETFNDGSILSGHGGGDMGIIAAFTRAVAERDPSRILSGPEETLESHLMVFAAEESRKRNKVVSLP